VLVANMTRGADGRWSALDGRQLYLQAKTAGTLYQTALRYELRHLGVQFRLRPNDTCEIAGVPAHVLRAFSQRRAEIEAHMVARGETSRSAAQVAALATRKAKHYGVRPESLAAEWHARAERLGFDGHARPPCSVGPGPLRPARRCSPAQKRSCSGRVVSPPSCRCSTAGTHCAVGVPNCPQARR